MDTADAAREERLERLIEQGVALRPEQRAAFLTEACGADAELRGTLEVLVARAEEAYHFVDRVAGPTVARAAGVLLGDATAAPGDGTDALTGRRVAHFEVLERLGGGGMGLVYKALDLRLGRTVALKFLPPHLGADDEAKRRFAHEAKAASALDHPSICTIHEIGETDAGRLFIAMAYCDGETLKQKIARGPLPVSEALDYAAQIAGGLQRAHEAGIVHRDVKPANVMITDTGQAKIVDFGLAKVAGTDLTREGTTIGTVAYMSPEQTRGGPVDARTDVWSLGAVLYEMLTGRRPFPGESDEAVIYAIRHDEPKPVRDGRAAIPAALAIVVRRCLDKDPARRYQRADEVLADIRTVQAGGKVRRRTRREHLLRYGGAGGLLFLLLVVGGGLLERPATGVDSLAVLPVTAVTGDATRQEFADGMTDLLIDQLSQLSGLRRVVSRASVMPYRDSPKSPRQIGRELGVDALVKMSVLQEGERVRINVNLIEADAERVLWSRSFERRTRDVLTLQREVVQAVARELRVQLTPREEARLVTAAREVNPEAFALYLQAARVLDGTQRMAYLEQAIEKDSAFALAHAKVATLYIMIERDRMKAERAIAKALALDPSLSDAYDALGLLRMWLDRDWPAAEAALRRAIELSPNNGLAHHELGQLFMRVARCDEAVAEEQRAVLQNPGVAHYQSGLAEVYLYCRRYDEAIREFGKALDLVRDSAGIYFNLGDAYFHQRQYAKALTMYEKSRRPPPGWIYVALGSQQEARAQIGTLKAVWARGEGNGLTTWNLARLHTTLGEREEAITWLERTYEGRHGMVVYLKVHPHFDSLRGEPRFQALLKKVRLAD
jgi:TolB-like protein/Flp pilus assembly protein TadD